MAFGTNGQRCSGFGDLLAVFAVIPIESVCSGRVPVLVGYVFLHFPRLTVPIAVPSSVPIRVLTIKHSFLHAAPVVGGKAVRSHDPALWDVHGSSPAFPRDA